MANALNEHQIRSGMILRTQQIDKLQRTLDAVIHDAGLLKRQLAEELTEWKASIELSLQHSEARQSLPKERPE